MHTIGNAIGTLLKWIFCGLIGLIAIAVTLPVMLVGGAIVLMLPWMIIALILMMAWGQPTIWAWLLLFSMIFLYAWLHASP